MRYISIRQHTVKHSSEILWSQERWGEAEEYLQGDQWKMQEEEEQVVLLCFNNVSILKFSFFPDAGIQVVRVA